MDLVVLIKQLTSMSPRTHSAARCGKLSFEPEALARHHLQHANIPSTSWPAVAPPQLQVSQHPNPSARTRHPPYARECNQFERESDYGMRRTVHRMHPGLPCCAPAPSTPVRAECGPHVMPARRSCNAHSKTQLAPPAPTQTHSLAACASLPRYAMGSKKLCFSKSSALGRFS